jgi:hypothetical protein
LSVTGDKVFLALPSRGSVITPLATALFKTGKTPCELRSHSCSLLTLTFNSLWAMALNERANGFTHFAMIHDDIWPMDDGWLDLLLKEFKASGADVLSTCVPIKDDRGLTSTAVMHKPTQRMIRLTMTEVCDLPDTFNAKDCGYDDCVILPNTGLWICDFTKPWVERICFTMKDRIFKGADGQWVPQCFGEDWGFGVQLAEMGLKVSATTALKVVHQGKFDYPNFAPWGGWKKDETTNILWNPPAHSPVCNRHCEVTV